jgi:RP/EB family microtubule-associated protein
MKKGGKLGRLELLSWINELTESDYPRIESLSDGVAYCQVLDHLHPKTIQLSKLNCKANLVYPRSEDDNYRNLKVLEDALARIRSKRTIDTSKLSRSKFPDNMDFLQWLYQYWLSQKDSVDERYPAYSKRLEAYKKQKKIPGDRNVEVQMSSHLIPNDPDFEVTDRLSPDLNQQRKNQLKDLVLSLEQELTNQVSNYKLLQEDIQQVEEERNFYFQKLRQIEILCGETDDTICGNLIEIISATPEEFLRAG